MIKSPFRVQALARRTPPLPRRHRWPGGWSPPTRSLPTRPLRPQGAAHYGDSRDCRGRTGRRWFGAAAGKRVKGMRGLWAMVSPSMFCRAGEDGLPALWCECPSPPLPVRLLQLHFVILITDSSNNLSIYNVFFCCHSHWMAIIHGHISFVNSVKSSLVRLLITNHLTQFNGNLACVLNYLFHISWDQAKYQKAYSKIAAASIFDEFALFCWEYAELSIIRCKFLTYDQ